MSPCAATSGGFVLRRFPSGFFCCVLAGALVCVVAAAGAGCIGCCEIYCGIG